MTAYLLHIGKKVPKGWREVAGLSIHLVWCSVCATNRAFGIENKDVKK